MGLTDFARRPTRVLSRGQQQRLSLARALVHDPSVLLLDEPASGLDPRARVELRLLVRRLADEGRTVLVSSHVLAELDELADHAVFVRDGATVSEEAVLAASAAPRDWRIELLDPVPPAVLQRLADARRDRDGWLAAFDDAAGAAAFLAGLVRDGALVSSFAPAGGELERTYLALDDSPAPGREGER